MATEHQEIVMLAYGPTPGPMSGRPLSKHLVSDHPCRSGA